MQKHGGIFDDVHWLAARGGTHDVPSDLIWRWTAGAAQTIWSGRGQGRCAKAFARPINLYSLVSSSY